MRYLTFALTKGRLAGKTMKMLESLGITCEEMKEKDSRKLIFTNEELKLKFFLAKGPDVPTYVEYGAADIGVVGRDTIIEEGRKVHEVLDLGFGKCKIECDVYWLSGSGRHDRKKSNFFEYPVEGRYASFG